MIVSSLDTVLNTGYNESDNDYFLIVVNDNANSNISRIIEQFDEVNLKNNATLLSISFNKIDFHSLKTQDSVKFQKSLGIKVDQLPGILIFHKYNSNGLYFYSLKDISETEISQFISMIYSFDFDSHIESNFFSTNVLMPTSPEETAFNEFIHYINKVSEEKSIQYELINFEYQIKNNDRYNLLPESEERDILKYLQLVYAELQEFRSETRNSLSKILIKLSEVQSELHNIKQPFRDKIRELSKGPSNDFEVYELENIHFSLDEQILDKTNELAKASGLPIDLVNYQHILDKFEENSLGMIRSCLTVEHLINKEGSFNDFDFSLCAVGYWKAIEIELNIIIVDSIRKLEGFITEIPSNRVPEKNGKLEVYAGVKNKLVKKLNLNMVKNNKLNSFMFGDLLDISKNYRDNQLKEVLEKIELETAIIKGIFRFFENFTGTIRNIVNTYRNQCSHTDFMSYKQYLELKEILFSNEGAYKDISNLKKGVYSIFE